MVYVSVWLSKNPFSAKTSTYQKNMGPWSLPTIQKFLAKFTVFDETTLGLQPNRREDVRRPSNTELQENMFQKFGEKLVLWVFIS